MQPGSLPGQRPALAVVCFNSDREVIHRQAIGPWSGTFAWVEQHQRIKVPGSTRLASVELGLWGGTGEISVAQVVLTVSAAKPHAGGTNSSILTPTMPSHTLFKASP